MAETVEKFDFEASTKKSKYPWEEWTNGKIWKIVKGVDFDNKVESFIQTLRQRASDMKMRIQVAAEGDSTIYFNYLPKEKTEKEILVEQIKDKAGPLADYLISHRKDDKFMELTTLFDILNK